MAESFLLCLSLGNWLSPGDEIVGEEAAGDAVSVLTLMLGLRLTGSITGEFSTAVVLPEP